MTLRDADHSVDAGLNGDPEDCCRPELDQANAPQFELAYAETITSTEWQVATGPWRELVEVLLDHQEQAAKDGACFLPGTLRGLARKTAEVESLFLLVFDLDRGQPLSAVLQGIAAAGVEALIYSTYSHLITRCKVAIADYQRFTGDERVDAKLVESYLADGPRGLQEHVLEGLRVLAVDTDTGLIEIEHQPIEKYRVVVRLAQPFSVVDLTDQGLSLLAIKGLWRDTYGAVGRHLGLEFDPACSDLARAYYFPSHAPDAPYEAVHVAGCPLDLAPFLEAVAGDDGADVGTRDDRPKGDSSRDHFVTDRDGCRRDVAKWDAKHRATCRIVDVIRACAPGILNERGDNTDDKQHLRCPFEHEHADPGQGTGTFVGNPGREVDGHTVHTFTVHCRHAACAHRTRLDFLKGLIETGHLTFANLNSGAHPPRGQSHDCANGVQKYAKTFAFINVGGKVLLFNTEERELSQALLAEPDFERLHRHDYTVAPDALGQERTVYWAKKFLKRPPPETRFYQGGFCFRPAGSTDPNKFNMYRGLHVEASPSGSCDLFRELIFDVWASGNGDLGAWLWEYFLHMVARPGERVRTSIAVRGSQGAGKSIAFHMLRQVFEDMLLVVDNQNIVLGAFNESLIGKLAVVLEEAAFAGDRSAFQKMKNLITGETVHINPKHKAPITVENYARVFLISNEEHFLHMEPGDRRYTVIETSDAWKRTNTYERMLDQWANGGAQRFVWEALHHEFRTVPGTQTLLINRKFETDDATDQVSQSRDPLQQAIVDLLIRGKFTSMKDGSAIPAGFYWPMEVEGEIQSAQLQTLMRAMLHTLAANRVEHLTSLRRIIAELDRVCGPTETRHDKRKDLTTGLWRPAPTTRILPPRRAALDRALKRRLVTQDEYDAAVAEPHRF